MFGALSLTPAQAGHELPFYPSFYPQEIKIEAMDRAAGAARLAESTLHAYVGENPFGGQVPPNVTAADSFRSYVTLTFNPASASLSDRASRCAAAGRIVGALSAGPADYVFHPYAVTPYHADYLQHFDLADAAQKRHRTSAPPPPGNVKIRARGPLSQTLTGARLLRDDTAWDATIEEVDLATLLAGERVVLNGWLGPPWMKAGWFHAYLLQAGTVSDPAAKESVARIYRRLVTGAYDGAVERLNLERNLVTTLGAGCERVVVGYRLRREFVNSEYSLGVENVAHDAQSGLDSPAFIRTVKLKDFPWNGWLRVGVETAPTAAWNPIGGFTDPAGRLIWSTIGDPAFIPHPHGGGWLPNRASASVVAAKNGGIEVPPDALVPEADTGLLKRVSRRHTAGAKVVYRVLASAFHDGTRMTVADVLHPFSLAYRWGAKPSTSSDHHDPVIEQATALLRERLAGVRVVKVETLVREYSDVKFVYDVPVVEVYLTGGPADPQELAAIAPPWSAVPWHVTALMEEAVKRGLGAFSEAEARRRGVVWLDLARDATSRKALTALIDSFRAQGWVPPALAGLVTPDGARQRWAALKRFADTHGHLLVTNGPYRLERWTRDTAVLGVFRDLTYPLGVGSFDDYAVPLRAHASRIDDRGGRLEITAEVEKVSKFGRSFEIVKEPLPAKATASDDHDVPVCQYVIVDAAGTVTLAGRAPRADSGAFAVDLRPLRAGLYTILVALYQHGNATTPAVSIVSQRIDRPGRP